LALESLEVCLVVEMSSHEPRGELPVEFIRDGCRSSAMRAEHHGPLGCPEDVSYHLRQPVRMEVLLPEDVYQLCKVVPLDLRQG
jgi:hypothetical protein